MVALMATPNSSKQKKVQKRSITLVPQAVDSGCGIACLAMVTCQPYEKVKILLAHQCNWSPRRKKLHTHAKDLIAYLHTHSDIRAQQSIFPGWEQLQGISILGVNRERSYYHWVIVIKNSTTFVIIDPTDAEVYQGNIWINDAKDGYVADARSAFVMLQNVVATHIRIS